MTACLNNVKQIGLAVHMYLGDWDQFYPIATCDRGANNMPSPEPNIKSGLMPYVENNYALFRCPLDVVPCSDPTLHICSYSFKEAANSPVWGDPGVYGSCYPDGSVQYAARNLDDVKAPANCAIQFEFTNAYYMYEWYGHRSDPFTVEGCMSTAPAYFNLGPFYPHGKEWGNHGFADGHAKALSLNMGCTAYIGYYNPTDYCIELDHMYWVRTSWAQSGG